MTNHKLFRIIVLAILTQTIFITSALAQTPDERGFGNTTGQRIALVIGNAEYDNSIGKLINPVNDANDMAAALQRLGFKLVGGKAHLNLNRRQMLEQIREFGSQIKQGGVGVFYFAGHGVQVDKRNYLIPITNSLQFQEDAEFEAVDADAILREMEYANNSLNILILDACRNNGLPKKTRNTQNGLIEPTRKPSGVYIAYAARDGQTASENSGKRNGLYTQELLKNLETPNLRLEDIFIKTRVEVKKLSNRLQEPIEYGSLDGTFYLKLEVGVGQITNSVENSRNSESVFWNAIENSNDIGDFESYLRHIESGEFKGIYKSTAELKIVKLKKANILAAWSKFRPIINILLKYDYINMFSENLARVKIRGKFGFINKSGRETILPKYEEVMPFSEGLAVVKLDGKFGLIDTLGKNVTPVKYDRISPFSDGIAGFTLNNNSGLIDKTGREVSYFEYDSISEFSEGVAPVRLNSKWGVIDKTGKEVIGIKYDLILPFAEGLAVAVLNSKFGFIDKTGKEIIPLKYDLVLSFSEGLALVVLNNKSKLIDKNGKEFTIANYDIFGSYQEGLVEIGTIAKRGLMDKVGKIVVPVKYDDIWCDAFRKEGFIGVTLNGKKGFVDIYGNEYFDF